MSLHIFDMKFTENSLMIKINWLYFEVPNSFYNDFEDLFIIKNTFDPSVFSTLPTMYIYIYTYFFIFGLS